MNRKIIILAVTALALASLACSFTINLPGTEVKTGPTETENIDVPYLADRQAIADVTLHFGAGNLSLQPGATNKLISGTAKFNVADFKPTVSIDNNNINIEQGNIKLTGIPYINSDIVNNWNLSLGERPMSLVIKAGAYTGDYELGGLSIHSLSISDGASKVELSFSKPNLIEMTRLDYTTGASSVSMSGLVNANVNTVSFNGGAGSYTLDFSGTLQRDMSVNIDSGVSSVTIIVPTGTSAQVNTANSLITVSSNGGWEQHGNLYQLSGSGYTISIQVKMGAGSLKLDTSK
jgi:hypothetical protein